jgi:hypothetical protein
MDVTIRIFQQYMSVPRDMLYLIDEMEMNVVIENC